VTDRLDRIVSRVVATSEILKELALIIEQLTLALEPSGPVKRRSDVTRRENRGQTG
jgi:hypothetical protein